MSKRHSTSADPNPQPTAWPRCSLCKAAFVLRRAIVFSTKRCAWVSEWAWWRDCKHRRSDAEIERAVVQRPKRRRSR